MRFVSAHQCKCDARGRSIYKSDTNLMDVLTYNCFVYIVREGIKGVLGVLQPALREGEGFYADGSALCGLEWCY